MGDDRDGVKANPGGRRARRDDRAGVNTDLFQLVAAAADLCRKPLRHAVVERLAVPPAAAGTNHTPPPTVDPILPGPDQGELGATDRCFHLVVRSLQGERLPDEDLELEIYRSGTDLNLTLAWLALEEGPVLWHGSHPVWMDGISGQRCERPEGGAQLEALGRRLRALLVQVQPEPDY